MPRLNLNQLRERLNLSRFALRNKGLTLFCWIVIGVAGLFAFSSLKYALFPDITFPVVLVNATAPIETAAETEAELTVPLEAQLQPLAGLSRLDSTTSPGRAILRLNFEVNAALEETTAAVEQAIDQTDLAAGFDYEIIPLNLNEATAISYALTSEELPPAELAALVEGEILPTLRDIPGVLRVDLRGTGSRAAASGEGSFLAELQNPPTLIRFNGEAALAVQVVKQGEANTLEVVDRVETAIAEIREQQPQIEIALAATQVEFIRASTEATIDALVEAIVLAVLVILAFLRSWRATVITALSIPLSLLGTAIVMAIYGFNLETITLLALAIVIGIIVDDAIVEVENIMRHLEAGATPQQAVLQATDEIALTVTVSTLTIVAVFLPVALMGGTVGQFFKPFGLTVSAAVLFSLLVARTLNPVLAVYWLKAAGSPQAAAPATPEPAVPEPAVPEPANPAVAALLAETGRSTWLERQYSHLLAWSLRHPWIVVGLAIASLVAGIAIIPLIPQGFIPQLDQGQFLLNYRVPLPQRPGGAQLAPPGQLPTGLSAPQAAAAAEAAAAAGRSQLLQRTLQQADDLEAAVAQLPEVESVLTTVGGRGRPNEGSLYIQLREGRDRDTAAVQAQLRQDLPTRAGLETSVEDLQFVDTGGEKPLQVALVGEDLTALQTAAAEIQAQMKALPGFADVRISGAENTADAIVEISRQNGERVAIVSANLSDGNALGDATAQVVEIAESVVPPGVRIDLAGDSARAGEVLGSFGRILILAVICMLLVLLVPFGRLLEPAVVGLSLPLSVVGATLALWITRSDFGIVSLLGLLFLLGLLSKNAILLLDYINQLRRAGLERTDAIKQTGLVRLRPILMTTVSSVLGMVPIALGFGAGAELRQPMAVAIIGGLLTSTLLSLVVVPVLYTLLEDGWLKLTKRSA
ncbi:efflux RND transporter permease subunit [Nodosilinea sp. FACHB-131]|uniref:efflux RND transporter permease subunit n=1 Tax=Cyanophyceae TaxID=3028117 RepID=UPI001685FC77|nr:efflux RND transporter permease subunit [Nodosilinea sp. FACHB-131]MBD1874757.1 efflux RND transporter permease subunit [Nodosilinea sp. FACHB-131]